MDEVSYRPNHKALRASPASEIERAKDWDEDVPYGNSAS